MSESEMVRKCKEGDNNARKELYELYGRELLSLCYRYAGDRKTAEDLLHDGFLKAFTSIHSFTFKGDGSLKAWLYRIFLNTSLEHLRKKNPWKEALSLEEVRDISGEPDPDTDNLPMELMMRFVTELPDGYRTVFNLYVFEEWSHKEIGRYLGIREKSSASQFSRARKIIAGRIREALKKRDVR